MQEFSKTLTVLGMWANHDFYDSKKERLAMLKNVDMKETLWKIIIFLLVSARDQELYINVAMPLSNTLGTQIRLIISRQLWNYSQLYVDPHALLRHLNVASKDSL